MQRKDSGRWLLSSLTCQTPALSYLDFQDTASGGFISKGQRNRHAPFNILANHRRSSLRNRIRDYGRKDGVHRYSG
jgi:hypothetical protein